MERLVSVLYLFFGFSMVVFALLQVTARKKAGLNYRLGALFLCFGYVWLYYGLYRETRFAWAPWLLFSDVAVTYLVGPIMFSYAKSLERGRLPLNFRRVLPHLPAAAVFVCLLAARPYASLGPEDLLSIDPNYAAAPLVDILNAIGDLYFFCFIGASLFVVFRVYRAGTEAFRREFRFVLAYFLVGFGMVFVFVVGHAAGSNSVLALGVLLNGANSIVFFFMCYRHPECALRHVKPAAKASRAVPLRSPESSSAVLEELRRLVEDEGLYRDPDITLQALSARLGLQHHQLSQLLNDLLGTGFRPYINGFRLEEAKRLLAERPDQGILEIAYAVGFNSKSAFNSFFSKEVGLSPSDYRRAAAGLPPPTPDKRSSSTV